LLARCGDVRMQFNPERAYCMSEIIFEVNEDELDGGYTAAALGYGIYTQGDSLDQLRTMVKDAVACYFDESNPAPKIIRLHFVREEVLVQ
jgi:predicted RNase H-like HicB family nuclease